MIEDTVYTLLLVVIPNFLLSLFMMYQDLYYFSKSKNLRYEHTIRTNRSGKLFGTNLSEVLVFRAKTSLTRKHATKFKIMCPFAICFILMNAIGFLVFSTSIFPQKFVLCNIARINNSTTVLDPYAGSCSTLLAAAIIAPSAESVGIEIAHDGFVNREHIYSDFTSRKLKIPNKLIHGDSTDPVVRKDAISAIDNNPFDVIIADPPYGIRESVSSIGNSPLEELFMAVASDQSDDKDLTSCNKRLLKLGGRLVAFVPVTDEQTLTEMLPSDEMTKEAGLELELWKEQIMNQKLSRWLVSYISIV